MWVSSLRLDHISQTQLALISLEERRYARVFTLCLNFLIRHFPAFLIIVHLIKHHSFQLLKNLI